MPKKKISSDLRQIFIERATSDNGKRKSLKLTEFIEKDGYLAKAEKKYSYFVCPRSLASIGSKSLKTWADIKSKTLEQKPRHVSIKRIFDKESGIGQTTCRTTGSFYVIRHKRVFAVAFMHSIKFDILGAA